MYAIKCHMNPRNLTFKKIPQKIQHSIFHFWRMQGSHYTHYSPYSQPVDLPDSSQQARTFLPFYPEAAAKAVAPRGQQAPSLADWTWDTTGQGQAGRSVQLSHWMAAESHNQWGGETPLRSLSLAYRPTHLASYTMALRAEPCPVFP